MCCLCYGICTWLDIPVFSDKAKKTISPIPCIFSVLARRGCLRTHTLTAKSREGSSWCCGLASIVKFGCYCIKFPPKNFVNCSMQSGQNPLKCQWIRHHRNPSLLLLFFIIIYIIYSIIIPVLWLLMLYFMI